MRRGFTLLEIMIVILVLSVIIVIAIPNLVSARKNANETGAIAAFKALHSAQGFFREQDLDKDGELDYAADLNELASVVLIDPTLSTGFRSGYAFQMGASTTAPLFLWFAVANPISPGSSGDRYFCMNHLGLVHFTSAAPIPLNTTDCVIPQGAVPIGR